MTRTTLSNIIGEIIANPTRFSGQQVEIIGFYRGWDLHKEALTMPSVTRSDWVIADNSGAIYVTGLMPENLNPSSLEDTNRIVRLVATVVQIQNGAYLQAVSVEVVSAE